MITASLSEAFRETTINLQLLSSHSVFQGFPSDMLHAETRHHQAARSRTKNNTHLTPRRFCDSPIQTALST